VPGANVLVNDHGSTRVVTQNRPALPTAMCIGGGQGIAALFKGVS
jgi:hypothetical protein